ncbi:MAG: Holliday junction resolvase RuvX [Bacteroidota bacterium]
MGRVLAIDYGTKRVGLAVTDSLRIIATGLETVSSKEVIGYLDKYFLKETIDLVVVGDPKTLMNKASSNAIHVEEFLKKFKEKFPLMKIERVDERFTSSIAQRTMLEGGLKKSDRKNKSTVDLISAVLILQTWMEMNPK